MLSTLLILPLHWNVDVRLEVEMLPSNHEDREGKRWEEPQDIVVIEEPPHRSGLPASGFLIMWKK